MLVCKHVGVRWLPLQLHGLSAPSLPDTCQQPETRVDIGTMNKELRADECMQVHTHTPTSLSREID
jgi:hypothetical protein